jgi:hypothetical protein
MKPQPHPANWSTPDLILELAARTVKSEETHEHVINGFLRLVRVSSQFTSYTQRHRAANHLRNLADDLENLNVVIKNEQQ